MATNKRTTELNHYKSVLPYASEIVGVYQPMIGWKSKRKQQRSLTKEETILKALYPQFKFSTIYNEDGSSSPAGEPPIFNYNVKSAGTKINESSIKEASTDSIFMFILKYGLQWEITTENRLRSFFTANDGHTWLKEDLIFNYKPFSEILKENSSNTPTNYKHLIDEILKKVTLLYNAYVNIDLYFDCPTSNSAPTIEFDKYLNPNYFSKKIISAFSYLKEDIALFELHPELLERGNPSVPFGFYNKLDSNLIMNNLDIIKKRIDTFLGESYPFGAYSNIDSLYFAPYYHRESKIAGIVLYLLNNGRMDVLNQLLSVDQNAYLDIDKILNNDNTSKNSLDYFDPVGNVKNQVSISPLGIVHLFRQYFFELDTFLGTPVNHIWLSPGSSVELVETTTRRTLTEKTFETSIESIFKQESNTTQQDDLSEAVKQDNKDDLKLGVTATVTQRWGTGNATASASLNMDKTQQNAREQIHKTMRQQSEKLSREIRENYKSTFKTITEVTDVSSKRYLLANNTRRLINYELRRKMRQVSVQVQDIGSYLCWETYIDDPGNSIGLADLVHISKPADLAPIPNQNEIGYPANKHISFQTNAVWDFGANNQMGFVVLTHIDPTPAPEGYEVQIPKTTRINVDGTTQEEYIPFEAFQVSGSGEDFKGAWGFQAKFETSGKIAIGVITSSGGLEWNKRVDFVVSGTLTYTPTKEAKVAIDQANKLIREKKEEAKLANDRTSTLAFINAAKERIEMVSNLKQRKFEDLREEERIIVYRNLLDSLMIDSQYHNADNESRHILSELINTIFDIDKMLYFVAPEWWKPRATRIKPDIDSLIHDPSDSISNWADYQKRENNYLVTDKTQPAKMGSSLGWLLQLDGDNLRNAFLNAPWVKAVIPIRPGQEKAATNWLSNVHVEGADGLNALYQVSSDTERNEILTFLGNPTTDDYQITLQDAIDYLCDKVAKKHKEAIEVQKYPAIENDDNKVSSTPIEKVYEHGFYPLEGGFRVDPKNPEDPNNQESNFQIFDQWIEILPTDQVVPVEVKYDPKTGRQI